jgi:hypothetical protein
MSDFGSRVTQIALDWWKRGAQEGTKDGDNVISELLGTSDWPRDAWCGMTVGAWYERAGLKRDLKSVGRALYGFGCGNRMGVGSKARAFKTYADPGAVFAAGRLVTADLSLARPGDIILHQKEPRSFNGHVMMCLWNEGKRLTTIEGNGTGILHLPGLPKAQGICIRCWDLDKVETDRYLNWVVRPAPQEVQNA